MIIDTFLFPTVVYLGSIFGFLTLVFFLALAKADNSIMDIAYGPTYAIAAIALLVSTQNVSWLSVLVVGAIVLWATRLSTRIYRKNAGKPEDERYAAWRRAWLERGRAYFIVRSYLQVFVLQGCVIAAVGLPAWLAFTFASPVPVPSLTIGMAIFVFGLTYETIADWQLDRFLAKKKAGTIDDPLMRTGLFRYSRRPNYFGEATIWTGLAIATIAVPYGWIGLVSPILITYIVTQVTGPMLENIFLEKYPEEYRDYMVRTSYIVPWPPKTSA